MISPFSHLFSALEFASLPMLGWLAAAALPWLIHRWQRRHYQTTPWAAVELLLGAMQQRARRVQIEQWLLLAVRTAILVLVALAVAEPALRQWAVGAGGETPSHRILVVDQSYSMGGMHQGVSRWQRARASARQWIENSNGDALTFISWSAQAENQLGRPTFEPSMALAALEDLQLSQTSAHLPTALLAVMAAIDRAEVEVPQIVNHQVVFFTDMGRPTWFVDNSLRELVESVSKRANVTLVNVAEDPCDNVAVTDLKIEPEITLRQRETTITASVTCFGKPSPASKSVELWIEGHRVDQQDIDCIKNGETTVRFTRQFVSEGAQTIQVVLANNKDNLAIDDERWLVIDILPQLRVACFAGQPSAADDLARALAPRGERSENDNAINPEIYSISRLTELDLSNYEAVLLGGVSELSPREAAVLTEYVRQGGGLAVFLGPTTSSEHFNELQQLFPVRVEGLQPTGEYRFDPQEYRHPIVSPFRGQVQSGLLGVSVSQFWRLQVNKDRPSTEVVLKFDTGEPALVVDRFGLGRIAVSALPGSLVARTATGTPWSSFAVSPSFLPIIRELVTYLVGESWSQQRNLLIGEIASFPWVSLPNDRVAKTGSVRLPEGGRHTLLPPDAEDHEHQVFRGTDKRGIYRFFEKDKELARFAVNLDGRESDLRPVDPATLPASFMTQAVQRTSTPSKVSSDFPFDRTLLAGAIGLLLLEIGLAQRLGRGWG